MKRDLKLWIVENDPDTQFIYRDTLGLRYHTDLITTLAEFNRRWDEAILFPDLVIAELSLPDGHFFDTLQQKNAENSMKCPFVVVSGVDDLDILRACFREGAADCLIKPIKKNEMILRIERVLLERQIALEIGRASDVYLDTKSLRLNKDPNLTLQLTLKEFQIISLLHQEFGRPVPKATLYQTVWRDVSVCDKTLDVHLFNLRKKITKLDLEIKYIFPEGYVLFNKDR